MQAVNLNVEYLTNPIGIDIRKPRLSWTLDSGIQQHAYQIIAKDEYNHVLWDSGKVNSFQMHLIPWGGEELKSRTVVTWSVMIWDENDSVTVSEPASFEMGLLEKADWKAKWITGNYSPKKKHRYPVDCFRKTFVIDNKSIRKARIYMSACGVYEGNLNGQKIGRFVLAPGITDYRKRVQYQTVDITNQLANGENTLTFMLADGWYRGSVGAWGLKNYYGTETKLLAQLEITYDDNAVELITTDESFTWTNDGPIRFADNKDGEIYDARLEDFHHAHWQAPKLTKHSVVPSASNNFDLTEHEHLTNPKHIITPSGKHVLDFGQNIAGIVSFKVNAKEGQRIFMRFGELIKDGEFTQKNIQCAKKEYRTPLQQVEYFCKDGLNEYKTRFAIFGYQYIEVDTEIDVDSLEVEAIAVYSDFQTTFQFESSNPLLNQFVKNTLWSLKNNSADLPTDCPTRERHGWSGDAQIFINTASYMVNFAPFALKYETDLCDWQSQDKDGNFPQIAPEGGTDFYMRGMNGSVGWSDAGIMIPYRLWKKYGDQGIIARYYNNMKRYAKYMIKRTGKSEFLRSQKTGLPKVDQKYLYNTGQHYGEWAEPSDVYVTSFKDFISTKPEESTAYLSYVMAMMVEIAQALGKTEDIALYKEYRDGAKATYQKLRKQPNYTLDTNRQAQLVRPLYMNLMDEKDTEFARKRLIQALEDYKWRVGTGFLSTPFILYVLSDIDSKYAYKLLENEENPGWLCMPKANATTIWEDWAGPNSDNGNGGGIASLNHYSKGAVCEWVFDRMCGISVSGENHFMIAPQVGGQFTHASMKYDSVYGSVYSSWNVSNGEVEYTIVIPPNTSATVKLAGREEMNLTAGIYRFQEVLKS